jgi:dolichol-phosphate mannosyltransferase
MRTNFATTLAPQARPQSEPFGPAIERTDVTALELAVVIPTFNERDNVPVLLARLQQVLAGIEWEAIVVDDDSPDGTTQIAREVARSDRRVRVIKRIKRRGLSSACIEGMLATCAPFIAVMDADLQHDETLLPDMLATARSEQFELVVASRNTSGGSKGDFARQRALLSDLGARLSHFVCRTRLTDPMSGFFLVSRDLVDEVAPALSGAGFKILVDIVASAKRPLHTCELPYLFGKRQHGESKLDTNVNIEYLNLLIEKLTHGIVPSRFVIFLLVGGTGAVAHLGVLAILFFVLKLGFVPAQAGATVVAMTFNFIFNNLITFRDRRLRGWKMVRGLVMFYVACAFGAFTNVIVAQYAFKLPSPWFVAGLAGGGVSSVWNYVVNEVFTWRRSGARKQPQSA